MLGGKIGGQPIQISGGHRHDASMTAWREGRLNRVLGGKLQNIR
jgi:hypothetical protein